MEESFLSYNLTFHEADVQDAHIYGRTLGWDVIMRTEWTIGFIIRAEQLSGTNDRELDWFHEEDGRSEYRRFSTDTDWSLSSSNGFYRGSDLPFRSSDLKAMSPGDYTLSITLDTHYWGEEDHDHDWLSNGASIYTYADTYLLLRQVVPEPNAIVLFSAILSTQTPHLRRHAKAGSR